MGKRNNPTHTLLCVVLFKKKIHNNSQSIAFSVVVIRQRVGLEPDTHTQTANQLYRMETTNQNFVNCDTTLNIFLTNLTLTERKVTAK